jgi:uncharacterized membrane protein YqjE
MFDGVYGFQWEMIEYYRRKNLFSIEIKFEKEILIVFFILGNFQVWIIVVAVIGGVVLIAIIIVICCVCRKCKRRSIRK